MEDGRRELTYRPAMLAAVALCIGLTAVLHPLNLLFLPCLFWFRRPLPVALAFALGLALAPRPVPLLRGSLWIDGPAKVLSVPSEAPEGLLADVGVGLTKLRAVFPKDALVSRGDVWVIKGDARPLSEATEALRFKGIRGKVTTVAAEKISEGPFPWRIADAWRRSYARFARQTLKPDDAKWLLGFAFRLDSFDEEEHDALVSTGTIHLIAASGIHVAAVGWIGMLVGSAVGAPRKAILAMTLTFVVLYAMATGLHLPTVRAALAFAVGSSAYLVRREPDGLSALALAVLTYLPFDPAQVYGIGFQLSTVVVGMLALWPHRDRERVRSAVAFFRFHARELVAVSLIAGLAAEPILACREGSVALLTVPANILAVPAAMSAILLGFIFHLSGAAWAMPLVGGLVSFARGTIIGADHIPDSSFSVLPFSPYLLVPFYAGWIWFWRPRARPCP